TWTGVPAAVNSAAAFSAPSRTRCQCSCVEPFGITAIVSGATALLPPPLPAPAQAPPPLPAPRHAADPASAIAIPIVTANAVIRPLTFLRRIGILPARTRARGALSCPMADTLQNGDRFRRAFVLLLGGSVSA